MKKGQIKLNRARNLYTGFKGTSTMEKVFQRIPDTLVRELTSKQIAFVAEVIAEAYNDGKASAGAEMIDANMVYIDNLGKIIEWSEKGAEYQKVIEKTDDGCTVVKNKKIKDGILVLKFVE